MQITAAVGSIFFIVFQNSRARDGPSITAKISQLEVSNLLFAPAALPDQAVSSVTLVEPLAIKEEIVILVQGVLVTARLNTTAPPAQIVRLADCSIKVASSSVPGEPKYVTVSLDTVPLALTHHQLSFVLEARISCLHF